jgi:hypothetical protein
VLVLVVVAAAAALPVVEHASADSVVRWAYVATGAAMLATVLQSARARVRDYAGEEITIRPVAGNPAIDHVACTGADQRGIARPQGFACDVGAVELSPGLGASGPLTLGVAQVGQHSAAATTIVTNTGELDAAIIVTLTGPNASEVEAVADPDACTDTTVLAPGATCKLTARLSPTTPARRRRATRSRRAAPSATARLVGTQTKAGKGGKFKLRMRCTTVGSDRCTAR